MSVPSLPKLNRLRLPFAGRSLENVRCSSESKALSALLELRKSDMASFSNGNLSSIGSVLSESSPFVKFNGCRMCPFYGTAFCYRLIVPPSVFGVGICPERVNELLDVAELFGSSEGLSVRLREAVERIRKHIILLEANLFEYRKKRFEELKLKFESENLVKSSDENKVLGGDGSLSFGDDNLGFNSDEKDCQEIKMVVGGIQKKMSLDDLKKEDIMFDDYETEIMRQVEVLASKYAEFLQNETKIEAVKGVVKDVMSLSDIHRVMRELPVDASFSELSDAEILKKIECDDSEKIECGSSEKIEDSGNIIKDDNLRIVVGGIEKIEEKKGDEQ